MMTGKPIKVRGAKRLRNKEVIPFTRQLASMLGAGMTILASIQTLGEQCADQEFKKVLHHLSEVIEGGAPMSNGLADFPQLFDEMYVNMVIAGEQSGEFAGIMKRLANILQSSSRLRKKVKSAMTYPTVIVSIALILAAGLIQFVVPVFAEMFSGFGKELPWLTQKLVDVRRRSDASAACSRRWSRRACPSSSHWRSWRDRWTTTCSRTPSSPRERKSNRATS